MEDFHALVSAKPSEVTESHSIVRYVSVCCSIYFMARVCSRSVRFGNRRLAVQKPRKSHSADMLEDLPDNFHFQSFQIQLSRRPVMSQEKKERGLVFRFIAPKPEKKVRVEVVLEPALRQLGTAPCPVCQRETAAFLTKTNRPFQNCGFCSARVFYNGHESMRLLMKKLKAIERD